MSSQFVSDFLFLFEIKSKQGEMKKCRDIKVYVDTRPQGQDNWQTLVLFLIVDK